MNIHDRVVIQLCGAYHDRFRGSTGEVKRLSDICRNQVGVLIDGHVNTRSKYGVYWFPKRAVKPSSDIEESHVYIKNEREENPMLKGYNVAFLEFQESSRKVAYACYDKDIKEGDMVVAATMHHGFSVAEVVEVVQNPDYNAFHVAERQIVSKIDFNAYNERIDRENKLKNLKKEMDAKVQELQSAAIYEMMAEKDPALAEMLKQFKALSGQ